MPRPKPAAGRRPDEDARDTERRPRAAAGDGRRQRRSSSFSATRSSDRVTTPRSCSRGQLARRAEADDDRPRGGASSTGSRMSDVTEPLRVLLHQQQPFEPAFRAAVELGLGAAQRQALEVPDEQLVRRVLEAGVAHADAQVPEVDAVAASDASRAAVAVDRCAGRAPRAPAPARGHVHAAANVARCPESPAPPLLLVRRPACSTGRTVSTGMATRRSAWRHQTRSPRARPITIRWTSLVPSPISRILASR